MRFLLSGGKPFSAFALTITTRRKNLGFGLRNRSDPALRPHKTLDRACQHEEIWLPIRSMVFDDLLVGNPGPRLIEPRKPGVLGILAAVILHLEFCLHDVSCTTAG